MLAKYIHKITVHQEENIIWYWKEKLIITFFPFYNEDNAKTLWINDNAIVVF